MDSSATGRASGITQLPAITMRSMIKRYGISAINSTPCAASIRCFFRKKIGIRTKKHRKRDASG